MRAIFVTSISVISFVFFILDYKYFQFGSDFYFKSNFLVVVLLFTLYFLGFFLGRFFPFADSVSTLSRDEEEDENKSSVDFGNISGENSFDNKKDNLQLIEGIGPKVQELLYNNGIFTFTELSTCSVEKLYSVLAGGGDRFSLCNPETWPYQSELAAAKNWGKLKEYQDFLLRGNE